MYGLFILTSTELQRGVTFDSEVFYDADNPLTLKEHVHNVYNRGDSSDAWDHYDCIIEASHDYKNQLEKGYPVALVNYDEGYVMKTSYPEE